MKTQETRRSHLAASLAEAMAALLLLCPIVRAQETTPAPKPPVTSKAPAAVKALGGLTTKAPPAASAPAVGKSLPTGVTAAPPAGRGPTTPPQGAPPGRVGTTPAATPGRGPANPAGGAGKGEPGTGTGTRPPERLPGSRRQGQRWKDPRNQHPPKYSTRTKAIIPPGRTGLLRDTHISHQGSATDIHHGSAGGRRVEVARADHSRIVAEGGRRGYVQQPYRFRNNEFAHRTYYVNGRAYDRFYARYEYRGAVLEVYAPVRYYPPAFYGWAYNTPWAPVPYAWGWAGDPWYGYYGAYFTPYGVYPNASLWLTDYLIAQSLQGAYQAQLDAQIALTQPSPPGQVALTLEVKQAIANEVQREVALENAEAQSNLQNADFNAQSSGVERLLTDGASHVFVVGGPLDLIDATGQECAVTEGDVLQLNAPPPSTAPDATLIVMFSKVE